MVETMGRVRAFTVSDPPLPNFQLEGSTPMCLGVGGLRRQGHLIPKTCGLIERRGAGQRPLLPSPSEHGN